MNAAPNNEPPRPCFGCHTVIRDYPNRRSYLGNVFGFVVDNGKVIRGCPGDTREVWHAAYHLVTQVFAVIGGYCWGRAPAPDGSRFASRKPDTQRQILSERSGPSPPRRTRQAARAVL